MELVYSYAMSIPVYMEQYAMVFASMLRIAVSNGDQKSVTFFTLLKDKCQEKFVETGRYEDLIIIEELREEIELCTDDEHRKKLIEELSEEKNALRLSWLSNVCLIGQLYRNNTLNQNQKLVEACICKLISNDDEDSYECLCSLLKLIGAKFEKYIENKDEFNQQIEVLEQVVEQNKIAPRIKFLIMDILEMRKNAWRPRKLQDLNRPKTLEEVHEDARKQQEQSNKEMTSQPGNKRNNPDSNRKRNDNWMHSNSRKSQQSSNDALSNIRKLNVSVLFFFIYFVELSWPSNDMMMNLFTSYPYLRT